MDEAQVTPEQLTEHAESLAKKLLHDHLWNRELANPQHLYCDCGIKAVEWHGRAYLDLGVAKFGCNHRWISPPWEKSRQFCLDCNEARP